jgi:hypothetical protein
MTPDILHLTDAGEQAIMNADAGGVHIQPRSFRVGDHTTSDVDQFFIDQGGVPSALVGNTVHAGNISYIEVRDRNTVRFTIDIPQNVPNDPVPGDSSVPSVDIGEVVIYLDDGTPLGYCIYQTPYPKPSNESLRIEVLLHVETGGANTIDVTLSEFGSIPSVASIEDLPSPVTAIANAISVLDMETNVDGSSSPGIVQRYGSGAAHWKFSNHTRIFSDEIGGGGVDDPTKFRQQDAVDTGELEEGSVVIVQVVAGPGAGESRQFTATVDGADLAFTANGSGFSDLGDISVVSIWKPVGGTQGSACPWPPGGTDVPHNWVLQRGLEGCPEWVPPLKPSSNGSVLYHPPGRLRLRAYVTAPEDTAGQQTFELYTKDLRQQQSELNGLQRYSHTHNNSWSIIALGGVNQHREAFEMTENQIEFAEEIPTGVQLDARLFSLEPSAGHLLNIFYSEETGDGTRTAFDIPVPPGTQITSPDQCLVYIDPFLQSINGYTIDVDNQQVVFVTPPPQGLVIEINALVMAQVNGYATHVHTHNYFTQDITRVIQLPFRPQGKEYVFASEQGLHVNRSLFDLVDDRLIFRRDIDPNREIELMIFRNVLSEGSPEQTVSGVITDAVVTSKSIELIRHNEDRLRLPVPKFNIGAGTGINVRGRYPNYIIESDIAQTIAQDRPQIIDAQRRLDNAEEITFARRIEFNGDVNIIATADFSARLGPGFATVNGLEHIQYVLGFRTVSRVEPEYGRNIRGTGDAGFNVTNPAAQGTYAYADKSLTQSYNIVRANNPAGYIEIVAKMRVRNGAVSDYGSTLGINLNIKVEPVLG